VLAASVALLITLNAWATLVLARDRALPAQQRVFQVAIGWFLPIVGAAVTLSARQMQASHSPGPGKFEPSTSGKAIDLYQAARNDAPSAEHISHDP